MSAYTTDLLDLIAEADDTIECGCDPDQHDTVTCRCGHRIVDHNPRAVRVRPCTICHCRALVRQPHRGNVVTSDWVRELRAVERREALA